MRCAQKHKVLKSTKYRGNSVAVREHEERREGKHTVGDNKQESKNTNGKESNALAEGKRCQDQLWLNATDKTE